MNASEHIIYEIKDGILHSTYQPGIITLEIAKEVVRYRKEFCNGKPHKGLVKSYQTSKVTKEARDFFSSEEATHDLKAVAIVQDSGFGAALANFFMIVTKPKMPVKLFTSEEKALEWLRQLPE